MSNLVSFPIVIALAASLAIGTAAAAEPLSAEAVNGAAFSAPDPESKSPSAVLLKAQVLLDRARISPGEIDGRDGENTRKALAAFARLEKIDGEDGLTPAIWEALIAQDNEPVLVAYRISEEDARAPIVEKIPDGMEEQAGLERLGYTSPREMLAERFHMSERLLEALNPGADFGRAGVEIVVAAVDAFEPNRKREPAPDRDKVVRIEIDKTERRLYAYREDDSLAGVFPASIGSSEKPAPSGGAAVTAVARNPTYTYDPKFAFKGVDSDRKFTIKPGPNNPVGAVWIDLDIPTYGIHGTPEPAKVGKSYSHGCVRLTNWDVDRLAGWVRKGTRITFLD